VRVLGLDPGSRRTGFGVVDLNGNRMRCVAQGHAAASARLALPERLHVIVDRIAAVMDEHAPDCVAIEEAFYHDSVRSTLVLGHVRGALIYAAMKHGLDVAEYSPREVKLSVAGGGGAAKTQVEFMVRRLLGLTGTLQADAADALGVAICHLNRSGRSAPARAARVAARGLEALLARRRAR
jgi:crossover junction endodeoxyribonuclease RuvC